MHYSDGNVANLVMIEIPDRLVGFFKIARSRESSNYPTQSVNSAVDIGAAERGPLSHVYSRIYCFKNASKIEKQKGHTQQRTTAPGALFEVKRKRK